MIILEIKIMNLKNITTNKSLFQDVKVAVIGDIMLDHYVYGDVNRISPEAPVPVLNVVRETNTLGGAGNVAANLTSLGAIPYLIGRSGNDIAASKLKDVLRSYNILDKYIITTIFPTTQKTRIVSQGQQIVRIDQEVTDSMKGKNLDILFNHMEKVRKECDIIIVSDYNKGIIDQAVYDKIKDLWENGTIIVDPKVGTKSVNYDGASFMTPNLKESYELLNDEVGVNSDEKASDISLKIVNKFKMDGILCTRADEGLTLIYKGEITHIKPIEKHNIRDVSGAGDTVISVLAAGLAAGYNVKDVAELCCIAGGVVVSKEGTAAINWAEIVESMQRSNKYPPFIFR
jgi:rfaE bifunctional protein kinase chain/domain